MQACKSRKDEERQFWREFLQLYRALPDMWKMNSEGHRKRSKRDKALQILIAKMKEIDPDASKDSVGAKINSFRSTYKRELKKMREAMQSGSEHIPTLWYFHDLDFLRHEDIEAQDTSTLDDMEWNEENNDTEGDETSSHTSQQQLTFTRKRKKPFETPETDSGESRRIKLLSLACERLATPPSEAHMLARAWRTDYEKLSPDQQLYAKKFISDILFEGQLGTLHRNSITVNDPPPSIGINVPCTSLLGYNPGSPAPSNMAMHEDSRHGSGQMKQKHGSTIGSAPYPSLIKD
ncbi:uncharacterized protein LOC125956170 [Anopheles darlingi]|uniref:uncharacterized protein LOC125956170 n=1 Tax=Anopheles darlingi TaxID=43151 RepID=UPI0021000080|nr:uncharacterized protein LOC125956170 [Anopheles darlingi]